MANIVATAGLLEKRGAALDHLSENGFVGVMLPYTPLHYLVFGDDIDMLVMTSANLSDTPIMYRNDEAIEKLAGIADGFLLHDRDIQTRCDDSLCFCLGGGEYFLRRSRGYVPFPVSTHEDLGMALACGAEQKASFCLSKGNYVFPSQHIGDLKNIETYENYTAQIRHFERLFDVRPTLLACDLHPDYLSSAYAAERSEEENIPLVRVQHHHAHMAACMADNALAGEVIGLVWDGVGYGTDGTSWGGECLVGGYRSFRRVGSIKGIPLVGGDAVTKDPTRVAWALLREAGESTHRFKDGNAWAFMLDNSLNCPVSSGMGRLFDGVSAILGIKEKCSYEGQGAVLLEAAVREDEGRYPVSFQKEKGVWRFDWREMIRRIVEEQSRGADRGAIAARFHNTLVDMAVRQCVLAREESGLGRVVLSGGSFQNMVIMRRLCAALEKEGFTVYRHRRVSPNDEGLSLGQIMIAKARWEQ